MGIKMDESAALRHVSPIIADAFDKLNAQIVRLTKDLVAQQNREAIISITGHVTKKELESILKYYVKKYDLA